MTTKNIQDVVAELKRKHPCIVTDKMAIGNQSEMYIDFFDNLEDILTQLVKEVEAGERERQRDKSKFNEVVSFLESRETVIKEQNYPLHLAYDDLKSTIQRLALKNN